ncbi:MAG: ribonuclease P protein component [Bacteroidales bacterium]
MKATFKKNERLCGKKQIAELFGCGNSEFVYPFKMLILEDELKESEPSVQVLISVPKKYFRKAYQRNSMKRLIREAYRDNKSGLVLACESKKIQLQIALIYVAKEALDYVYIEKKMKEALQRITKLYE